MFLAAHFFREIIKIFGCQSTNVSAHIVDFVLVTELHTFSSTIVSIILCFVINVLFMLVILIGVQIKIHFYAVNLTMNNFCFSFTTLFHMGQQ